MHPIVWGPHAWKFINAIALVYPENPSIRIKESMKNFILSLVDILPCAKCAKHYKTNIEEYNIDEVVCSREKLMQWSVDIHNKVNKSQNKIERNGNPETILSSSLETKFDNYHIFGFLTSLVLLISLIFLLYSRL